MIIKKFFHSCLLIEEGGKRLLIDPGAFSFVEGKLKPEDIGPVDAILLTHQHLDHYFPEALKKITALKPATIVTHSEISALLDGEGLTFTVVAAGEKVEVAGFQIKALTAPHGAIPTTLPHNLAYLINETVLHPGDSLDVESVTHCQILALPVAAPWLRLVDALAFAKQVQPKVVIPIHDAIVKDFMLERMYQMCQTSLEPLGIEFKPLQLGETLTVARR